MQKHFSFRQKLGGAFTILLSFILLQGAVSWLALTEINARYSDLWTLGTFLFCQVL